MTNQRLVAITYVVFAIVIGLFLEHALGAAFGAVPALSRLDTPLLGESWSVTSLIAFAIAAAAAIACWRSEKVYGVSIEIAAELRKVTWPTWPETYQATVVVLIATFICAAILGAFDAIFQFLFAHIYSAPL